MAHITLSKLQSVLPEFVEERLLPSAPSHIKFLIGGALPLVLSRLDAMVAQYRPMMEQLGLLNEGRLDITKAQTFINSGFDKSGNMAIAGFIFTKEDGEALVNIMEKYRDD